VRHGASIESAAGTRWAVQNAGYGQAIAEEALARPRARRQAAESLTAALSAADLAGIGPKRAFRAMPAVSGLLRIDADSPDMARKSGAVQLLGGAIAPTSGQNPRHRWRLSVHE